MAHALAAPRRPWALPSRQRKASKRPRLRADKRASYHARACPLVAVVILVSKQYYYYVNYKYYYF